MDRLGRVQEERRRAGARERRGDLAADDAGLAHAGDDDAAAALAQQLDRARRSARRAARRARGSAAASVSSTLRASARSAIDGVPPRAWRWRRSRSAGRAAARADRAAARSARRSSRAPAPRAPRGRRRRRRPRRRPSASGSMYSARPAVTPSPPPGSCRLCVTSKTTGKPCRAHHRERAHVDDEVVVAEARAALGDDHARVAGIDDLRDGVAHVVGREELALLDVHDAPGPRGRDEQVGLAERNAGSAGRRRPPPPAPACDGSWMSVRIGTPRRALIAASTRSPSSRPGPRNDRPDVRLALSKDALKTNGHAGARARCRRVRSASSEACASLSMTHGPAISTNGRPPPIAMSPMLTGGTETL